MGIGLESEYGLGAGWNLEFLLQFSYPNEKPGNGEFYL